MLSSLPSPLPPYLTFSIPQKPGSRHGSIYPFHHISAFLRYNTIVGSDRRSRRPHDERAFHGGCGEFFSPTKSGDGEGTLLPLQPPQKVVQLPSVHRQLGAPRLFLHNLAQQLPLRACGNAYLFKKILIGFRPYLPGEGVFQFLKRSADLFFGTPFRISLGQRHSREFLRIDIAAQVCGVDASNRCWRQASYEAVIRHSRPVCRPLKGWVVWFNLHIPMLPVFQRLSLCRFLLSSAAPHPSSLSARQSYRCQRHAGL